MGWEGAMYYSVGVTLDMVRSEDVCNTRQSEQRIRSITAVCISLIEDCGRLLGMNSPRQCSAPPWQS